MPSSRRRSRDRHSRRRSRSTSRSRSRRRSRERKERRRSRSASKDRKKISKIEIKVTPEINASPEIDILNLDSKTDVAILTKNCEEVIKKRRERIEQWRKDKQQRRAREILEGKHKTPDTEEYVAVKKWNLEDDDGEDEEDVAPIKYDNEEDDSLDQFMRDLDKKNVVKVTVSEQGKAKVIKTIKQKTKNDLGHVMEQNLDEIEYSTEEEEETLESISIIAKKDKLPQVDHEKIYYQKIQKNFYIEIDEIKKMTNSDVTKYRSSLGGVKVKGKDCPRPIKSWAHCGLPAKTLAVLKMHKFTTPTPIQCQAIPAVMAGRDIISVAKTGSGKTLAYLLPLLRHVSAQPAIGSGDGPVAVIMCPTRELAVQIYREIVKLTAGSRTRCVCIYGGTAISEQIAKLKFGAEILVCTPGRMIDMLAVNSGRVTNLRRCSFVVLDEADRMFDMGFEPQVMTILSRIRPDRQTAMFSATFPRKMEGLARTMLQNPIEIEVGGKSIVCQDVSQYALMLDEGEKFLKLLELLGTYMEDGKVLVFMEKQESCDRLIKLLMQYGYMRCAAMHGGIDQDDRDSFISNFKTGVCPLLVATSVAARGLDVSDLNLVVNYDCPNHYEDYVHRCGRTGRAGNKGVAYTFITPDQERYLGDVLKAFKLSGATPPEDLVNIYKKYKDRMKQEGKKVHSFSGFKGKGFQFDEAESQLLLDKRRLEKDTACQNDSDEEGNLDEKIIDMFAVKKNVKEVDKNAPMTTVNTTNDANKNAMDTNIVLPVADQKNMSKHLEIARQAALKINMQKKMDLRVRDPTLATAEALFGSSGAGSSLLMTLGNGEAPGSGGPGLIGGGGPVSGKDLAAQKAMEVHNKIGYFRNTDHAGIDLEGNPIPGGDDEENDKDKAGSNVAQRYEEELEINEFPSSVRYKLTSKETMSNLTEYYGVGVSVRGVYMASGVRAKMEAKGDRPLYLCLEAPEEMKLQGARREVARIAKEEMLKLKRAGPNVIQGRYKVDTR